jgi:uncharacterized protein (DUF305 family)
MRHPIQRRAGRRAPEGLARGVLVGVLGVVALTACHPSAAGPATGGTPAAPADLVFVRQLLLHHGQAIQMAALVEGRTTRPELLRLADSIRASRSAEIAWMHQWLRGMDGSAADQAHGRPGPDEPWYPGMMAESQLRVLARADGQRFDFVLVDMLIEHHEGAVVMAREVRVEGRDARVRRLADSMMVDRQHAIGELLAWRRRWAEPFVRRLLEELAARAAA